MSTAGSSGRYLKSRVDLTQILIGGELILAESKSNILLYKELN
jgi:hypothetical protein